MSVYVVIFLILAALAAVEIATESPALRRVFPLVVAALVLFAGLRGRGVGFDYENYHYIFDDAARGHEVMIEPAFRLLAALVGRVGGFELFVFVVAALAAGVKGWFIGRWSPYLYTGLLVYFCTAMVSNDMGQIRYGLAVALCLVAFDRAVRGRVAWGWVWALAAVTFHYSALLVLPALLIVGRRIPGWVMAAAVACAAAFYFVSINDVLIFAARFIPVPYVQEKVGFYTAAVGSFGTAMGLNLSVVMRLTILALVWWYRREIAGDVPVARGLLNLYFYGVVLYMVLNSNAEFATRGTGYFRILEVVLLPALVRLGRGRADRWIMWGGAAAASLYFLSKVLAPGIGEPYWGYYNLLF